MVGLLLWRQTLLGVGVVADRVERSTDIRPCGDGACVAGVWSLRDQSVLGDDVVGDSFVRAMTIDGARRDRLRRSLM